MPILLDVFCANLSPARYQFDAFHIVVANIGDRLPHRWEQLVVWMCGIVTQTVGHGTELSHYLKITSESVF